MLTRNPGMIENYPRIIRNHYGIVLNHPVMIENYPRIVCNPYQPFAARMVIMFFGFVLFFSYFIEKLNKTNLA